MISLCHRCHRSYQDCICGQFKAAKTKGPITARVIWKAACATQRLQLAAGIATPRLTSGVIRPEGIERYIDSGRI